MPEISTNAEHRDLPSLSELDSILEDYCPRKFISGDRWAGVMPHGTPTLVVGAIETARDGYDDQYMYATRDGAFRAFYEWDGQPGTEPDGWLRAKCQHRPTRRRRDGTAATEYERE